MITCKQCGAEFDADLPSCPYCGELNYSGAEQEYLSHISDINKNMSDLADDSETEYKSGVKKTLPILLGIVSLIILFIGLLIGIYLLYYKVSSAHSVDEQRAVILWKNNYYDDLDTLYEQDDYDGVLAFLDEHIDDEGYFPYEWEHMDFIQIYQSYKNFLEDSSQFDSNDLTFMYWTLYDILYLEDIGSQTYYHFTESEEEQIAAWQAEAHAFLTDHMGMTESEIEEMKQETCYKDTTMPNSSKCKKYIKKRYDL